jgi:hypothetical protein
MAEALSSPPGLEHAFEVVEIAEEVIHRPKRSRMRALRKGGWSDFGNEVRSRSQKQATDRQGNNTNPWLPFQGFLSSLGGTLEEQTFITS